MTTLIILAATPPIKSIIISFIMIIIGLAVIAGLIYAVETWIIRSALPPMVRMVIGLILILLIVLWAFQFFGG
jgi:hypothetical protein